MLVKSEFWVKAFLKQLSLQGRAGYVIRRGHESAGEIIIKVNLPEGNCKLYRRHYEFDKDNYTWACFSEGKEEKVDESIKKQITFDPDSWILEVDSLNQENFSLDSGCP
tara:strand:- start:513 stop:839 length:327 start_codon:yes stop_codon:yes gene_type:complete